MRDGRRLDGRDRSLNIHGIIEDDTRAGVRRGLARGPPGSLPFSMTAAPIPPTPTPYEQLGGDAGVRKLVDRFYDLVDTAPEAATVRALHASSLKASREKLYLYLTTWTGGPPVYTERYGHPRLRMRHFPFRIGVRERDEWLWCMDKALDEHDMPDEMRQYLRERLHQLADHMRNQE